SQFRAAKSFAARAPDRQASKEIAAPHEAPPQIPRSGIVDCNQSVALLSRRWGKSHSAVIVRLARGIARDYCLLPLAAATGTLVTRAEEFMHNERVIAHSRAGTLSLAPHARCFFYLLLRCTKSLFRACHIWQKCESSNHSILWSWKYFLTRSQLTSHSA